MSEKGPFSEERLRFPEDIETLMHRVENDWDGLTRALAHTDALRRADCMMRLTPALQERPELVELLRSCLAWMGALPERDLRFLEKWLNRRILANTTPGNTKIAENLAREHDPNFPALSFDSPKAKKTSGVIREGSSCTEEWIQSGRGWSRHTRDFYWGPGEFGHTFEVSIEAVHPEWTLQFYWNDSTDDATECWYTFQSNSQ